MAKKSSTPSDARKKAAGTRMASAAGRKVEKTPTPSASSRQIPKRAIRWIEFEEPDTSFGHGVQFLHDELEQEHYGENIVAFLDGYGWLHRRGGRATVRLRKTCPTSINEEHWIEIRETVRQAVLVFLSNEDNFEGSFRHGPVHVLFNA
jgi:hypothetical protein